MKKPRQASRWRRIAVLRERSLDASLKAVVVEGFFTRLAFGALTFALPLYALQLGLSFTEVGLVAGAKALVQPLVKPLMGMIVDRYGTRRGYLAAVVLQLVGAILLLFVTSTAGLLAIRLLQGAASSARDPASITLLAARTRKRLGRTFSAAIGAKDLGNVSAGLLAGMVLAATGGRFEVLWVLVAVIALVPVLVVWAWVKDGPRMAEAERAASSSALDRTLPHSPSILRDHRLRMIASLGLLAGMTAHMTHSLFQVYAAEVAGLAPGQIGLIYSLSIAMLLIAGPLAGWAGDRFGNGLLASTRGVANALSSMVYVLFPSFAGVLGGRLIDDAGKAAFRPTWGALVASAAREAGPRRGRVAAGLDTALSLGEAAGPLLAGLIWDLWGIVVFFSVRAVLGIGTELLLGRRLRSLTRNEEREAIEVPDEPRVAASG